MMKTSWRASCPLPGRRLVCHGLFVVVAGVLAPVGAWMVLAPLTMAVVAPACGKSVPKARKAGGFEGGIVRAVLVREAGMPVPAPVGDAKEMAPWPTAPATPARRRAGAAL
jgi:hypothetical protein